MARLLRLHSLAKVSVVSSAHTNSAIFIPWNIVHTESNTTGNFAGFIFPLFTTQMFTRLTFNWSSTLFGCIATLMAPIPFVVSAYPLVVFSYPDN